MGDGRGVMCEGRGVRDEGEGRGVRDEIRGARTVNLCIGVWVNPVFWH